tara:strand:+ start:250 stop:441 length:192 start_codon:yes stop_codon:yes gene_type:complete
VRVCVNVCDLCKDVFYEVLPYRLFVREVNLIDSEVEAEICEKCYKRIKEETERKGVLRREGQP